MAENNNVPAVFAKSLKKVFVNKKNPALDSIALNGIDLTDRREGSLLWSVRTAPVRRLLCDWSAGF